MPVTTSTIGEREGRGRERGRAREQSARAHRRAHDRGALPPPGFPRIGPNREMKKALEA